MNANFCPRGCQKTHKLKYSLYLKGCVSAVLVCFMLSGCAGFVAVDQKFGASVPDSNVHEVEKGETLFSIAWRYGWDYKALASANSIAPPYTIHPGQKINVGHSDIDIPKKPNKANKTLTKWKPASTSQTPSAYKSESKTTKTEVSTPIGQWNWPAKGEVIAKFSSKAPVNKGIDIAGGLGESVTAAAAGTVVYAGSGLLGYGNLVIIKHDDTFLSAYAHNKTLLVKENQQVKAGEAIAEIGSSGTDSVKLHFEIRRHGKPVDPLIYLPKK